MKHLYKSLSKIIVSFILFTPLLMAAPNKEEDRTLAGRLKHDEKMKPSQENTKEENAEAIKKNEKPTNEAMPAVKKTDEKNEKRAVQQTDERKEPTEVRPAPGQKKPANQDMRAQKKPGKEDIPATRAEQAGDQGPEKFSLEAVIFGVTKYKHAGESLRTSGSAGVTYRETIDTQLSPHYWKYSWQLRYLTSSIAPYIKNSKKIIVEEFTGHLARYGLGSIVSHTRYAPIDLNLFGEIAYMHAQYRPTMKIKDKHDKPFKNHLTANIGIGAGYQLSKHFQVSTQLEVLIGKTKGYQMLFSAALTL